MSEIRNYICPICGMPMHKEEQVCSQCSDKIQWGESIIEYCIDHGGIWHNYEIKKPMIENKEYDICILKDNWYSGAETFIWKSTKFVDGDFEHDIDECVVSWFEPTYEIYSNNVLNLTRRIIEHIAETSGVSLEVAKGIYYSALATVMGRE